MASRTVTVACKAPSGLELNVMPALPPQEEWPFWEGDGKTRIAPVASRIPRATIYLRGPAKPIGVEIDDPVSVAGGYALTPDVDAELWETWLAQNGHSPMVLNQMVFATRNPADAKAQGREQGELRSNLEPMREKDIRTPKGVAGMKIERGTTAAA